MPARVLRACAARLGDPRRKHLAPWDLVEAIDEANGNKGDITQITTANLAARYGDPVSVGIGAVLALWVLAVLAITVGAKSLDVIPMVWVRRVAAVIMLGLAVWSAWAAAAG